VKKVVGEAHVKEVIVDSPEALWEKTNKDAGINKKFYDSYFNGRNRAVAFELVNVKEYDNARDLSDYGVKSAPQSFVYVDD
jgi:predicted transcriptional regulator